ncbi:MAG: hypothetical protein JST22_07555 [Bacteroidetes bacterium]|nr:hypothetical protein [Bacteroidota bacterium]
MKLIMEEVAVEPAHRMPRVVIWRKRRYIVRAMIDFWIAEGEWWTSSPMRRNYLRLDTDGGTMELFKAGETWHLSRISD